MKQAVVFTNIVHLLFNNIVACRFEKALLVLVQYISDDL